MMGEERRTGKLEPVFDLFILFVCWRECAVYVVLHRCLLVVVILLAAIAAFSEVHGGELQLRQKRERTLT